jgi:tetratricopeptide (TPR) repeat protein
MNFVLVGVPMSDLEPRRRRSLLRWGALSGAIAASLFALSPWAATSTNRGPVSNSGLDAPLFYQLLIGELELRSGEIGDAYQVMLDAARRTNDESLFRRTVQIALQGHAGNEALTAANAWHSALPGSIEPLRYQAQILIALNRPGDAMEPLGTLLKATGGAERNATIATLPRLLQRSAEPKQVAAQVEKLLQPYLQNAETRPVARVSIGRMWLIADDVPHATAALVQAQKDDPASPVPPLFALDLLEKAPSAEGAVTEYLRQPKPDAMVRLAYARTLTSKQRYAEAVTQLEALTRERPEVAPAWLTLGALQLELHHPQEAEAALKHYIDLAQAAKPGAAASAAIAVDSDDDDDDTPTVGGGDDRGLLQAWLLMSQAAEMRGDYAGAEQWLSKVDSPQRALEVQTRRAALLARQGKLTEARALVQKVPERSPEDARAKLLAEAQVLRDVKHWKEANEVLAQANQRFPNDPDLLYEQAMVQEKLDRVDEMEKLLRKVIEIKPDHPHAYNALGYSLADRNKRLPEAKALIEKALQLSPGEPFITDSLGWVEYRLGHRTQALELLRKAYGARPDTEIAAHLGEVLWVDGQRDEARKVLREARRRDAGNEVLTEVLARLKVDL